MIASYKENRNSRLPLFIRIQYHLSFEIEKVLHFIVVYDSGIMINLLWMYLVTQAAWMRSSWALYHDLSMQTIEAPEAFQNDSYFGYSMAYRYATKSLIVSAPRADYIGKLYSCDINTNACRQITVNIPRAYNYSHDYWLGATVKAGLSFVVTCAPLHMQRSYSFNEPIGSGLCFIIPNESDVMETLPQIRVVDRTLNRLHIEDTIDTFGWAIDVAPDNSIIVGGPAMFTGRVMLYRGDIKNTPVAQTGVELNVDYNFGYSVVSGYFLPSKTLIYAVGAPFGSNGLGKVIFLNQDLKFLKGLKKGEDEYRVGTMFGAVLCSARLKRKSDLLVGAPTYAGQLEQNVGAVYVYLYHFGSQKFEKKIVGFKDGSYFGSAILSVGDLDGDKKDEIVIAAPYENEGRGAVYLYSGADLVGGKTPVYLQRFYSEIDSAFGLSLTSIQDYDDNGCNELAIGSPGSNTVNVIKCIASVTAKIFAEFPDLQNRKAFAGKGHTSINETYFTFKSCIKLTYPPKPTEIVATLSVKVEISHQNAVLVDKNKDAAYNISLHRDKDLYCRDIGVSLPLNGNYDLEIGYMLTADLLDSPLDRDVFEKSRVLLSKQSVLSVRDSIWAAECKGESCEPELNAEILSTTQDTYMSGSTECETVSVIIRNKGDTAYSACMTVNITGAPVVKINSNTCSQDTSEDIIQCAPLQPLRTNETWTAGEISIETSQLTNKDEQISVRVNLYSKCQKLNDLKEFQKEIKLVSDYSGINIKGNTDVGDVVSLTIGDVKYDGKNFEHIYTITNEGLTNIIVSNYKILLPKYIYMKYLDVTLYLENANALPCKITSDNESEFDIAQCNYDKLEKRKKINVIISLQILPGTLENIIDKANVTIYTNMTMGIGSKTFSYNIESVVTLLDATVPLWIIILAVLIGFMILVIIALILREFGFLNRKNKKKLQDLRKSIRRQTIRRSMMAQRPHEEDQRILEEQDEVVHVDVDAKQATCLIRKTDQE